MTLPVNATLSVDYPATLAKNFLNPSLQALFQAVPQADVSLARPRQATEDGTIDVKNTNNLIFHHQRQNNFRITRRITGNRPVKRVNILDTLHLIAGNRSAAHPAPDGYPDTGNFALKWSEYQCIVLKQIKTCPVYVSETLV